MKQLAAISLAALTAFASFGEPVLAQEAEEVLPGTNRGSERRTANDVGRGSMTGAQEARLADAVRDVRDDFASSRVSNGIWGIVGGLIVTGLGGYIAYDAFERDPRDFGFGLFGLGIAGYGLSDVVGGIWNLAYETPQERIASKLLDDPGQLRASGMLFLEQEAHREKRARLVGGTLSIMTGVSAGVLLVPMLQSERTDQDTFLLLLLGATAGLQVLDGIVTLFGSSEAERRYEELTSTMSANLDVRVSPTLVAVNDGESVRVGPAIVVGARF